MLWLVQRVFWNPFQHEENRKLRDIRPSEFVAALVLVVLMVWIGVRPNDVLDRLRVSVEGLREAVVSKQIASRAP
jgi:NADH:ubiquinone oxidoreductase subunit 4 (subunit M)